MLNFYRCYFRGLLPFLLVPVVLMNAQNDNNLIDNHHYVASDYIAVLGRDADPAGYSSWTSQLDTGQVTRDQLDNDFVTCSEYASLYAAFLAANGSAQGISCSLQNTDDNGKFLTLLYITALGRCPDPVGYSYWDNLLNTGTSRSSVVNSFITSGEFPTAFTSNQHTYNNARRVDKTADSGRINVISTNTIYNSGTNYYNWEPSSAAGTQTWAHTWAEYNVSTSTPNSYVSAWNGSS